MGKGQTCVMSIELASWKLESVSKDDVLNVAQSYLPVDKYTIVVVGNEEVLEKIKVFDY